MNPTHDYIVTDEEAAFERAILTNMIGFVRTALGYATVTYRGATIARVYLDGANDDTVNPTLTLVDANDIIVDGCEDVNSFLPIMTGCHALVPGANLCASQMFDWLKASKVDPLDMCG